MRNPFFSKKLKRSEVRILIIDDNQIRFNQICNLLKAQELNTSTLLLDDVKTFEKQLHLTWDLIIFGRAYDLKVDQALVLIRNSHQSNLPLLLLKPDEYDSFQYSDYIYKGIYDILDLYDPEHFYCSLLRTLTYSRLQQQQDKLSNELEHLQNQTQYLVKDSNKALATIQEGIHIQANAEYLALFGMKSEEQIIGLPILDILQPKNVTEFKNRLKKATQGQLDLGAFQLESKNNQLHATNPLNIEFLTTQQDHSVQIVIEQNSHLQSNQNLLKSSIFQQINLNQTDQTHSFNALVTFSLSSCPEQVFEIDWKIIQAYFKNIKAFLKDQTQLSLFKVDTLLYVGLIQAESKTILNSKLLGLSTLTKPQLIAVNDLSFPLYLRIGYAIVDHHIESIDELDHLISKAFSTSVDTLKNNGSQFTIEDNAVDFIAPSFTTDDAPHITAPALDHSPLKSSIEFTRTTPKIDNISIGHDISSIPLNASISMMDNSEIGSLVRSLEKGEIHLKFQQLYDKEDKNLHTYEVTSSFIHHTSWKNCTDVLELEKNPELSIKVDRWILVEACKQLHNFIPQYPDAKLIINLNKHILFNDPDFPLFIAKLVTIVDSPLEHPLILQFSEKDLLPHIEVTRQKIIELKQNGAEISLRNFGQSNHCEQLLMRFDLAGVTLDPTVTQLLETDQDTQLLNEKLKKFQEIRSVNILLNELNDMNLFANAWDVSARFIQGDYFQKKLDQLIDVQDL